MSDDGKPMLSVVLPTYDRRTLLDRAVASVLAQSLADLELIVVDDGSTDDTQLRYTDHDDRRLRFLRQDRRGAAAARNLGLDAARGHVVTFLDSDDEVAPEWADSLVAPFSEPDVALVCCAARRVMDRTDQVRIERPLRMGPLFHGIEGLFVAGSFAVREDVLRALGGYDPELPSGHHTDLAIRLSALIVERHLEVRSVPIPLITVHVHQGDRIRHDSDGVLRGIEGLYRKHGDLIRDDPWAHSNYQAVAGVHEARRGYTRVAVRHLLRAIGARPAHLKNYARLLRALLLAPWRAV